LTKLEQNQGYQYSDGSSVTFTNWDYTEPSNTNGRENCVDLKNTGKWRDFYCYVNKGWICSIPRGIEPNSTDFMPSKFDSN
jgi:C-type mannose receptor